MQKIDEIAKSRQVAVSGTDMAAFGVDDGIVLFQIRFTDQSVNM